jgi:hypothetical protein
LRVHRVVRTYGVPIQTVCEQRVRASPSGSTRARHSPVCIAAGFRSTETIPQKASVLGRMHCTNLTWIIIVGTDRRHITCPSGHPHTRRANPERQIVCPSGRPHTRRANPGLSAFRPRGVPRPTSKLSPRVPTQMGRRETEHEGGKRRQTKGENPRPSCCPAPRSGALAVGGYKRSRGRERETLRVGPFSRAANPLVREPSTFLL